MPFPLRTFPVTIGLLNTLFVPGTLAKHPFHFSATRLTQAVNLDNLDERAMDISRPTSPEEVPHDLWSSILDSVSSSRSIPAKQVILLGEPSSGKSTLSAALLQKKLEDKESQQDFAIGYDWADVKDEEGELRAIALCDHLLSAQ